MRLYAYRTDAQGNPSWQAGEPAPLHDLRWHDWDLYSCKAYLSPEQARLARVAGGRFYVYNGLGYLTVATIYEDEDALVALGHASADGRFIYRTGG